ncbi:MAG: DUF4932 domain-containing protein [Cytophagaceae bacterium]|jgi:hypothetical protein|nr:DUF4932 domain-containing protein [Cytophagaceae bacterium]
MNTIKKIILSAGFVTMWLCAVAQTTSITPVVDARVELMSTVFRLAEIPEYTYNALAVYAEEVDVFFTLLKSHEIISYTKKLRKEHEVAYEAVMTYAIRLEIKNGTISFNPDVTSELDSRWTNESAQKFLMLLNDFYTKSNFQTFFDTHKKMYDAASQNFQSLLENVNFEWFKNFYGTKSNDAYRVILSLLNRGNYGPNLEYKDGARDVFSIVCAMEVDSLGNPLYSMDDIETLVHEFNHSFCNKLIDENYDALASQAQKFYKLAPWKLELNAYGNAKIMLYEMLVRASVFQYMHNKVSEEQLALDIGRAKGSGFWWIDELNDALTTYRNNRSQYPALSDFMPEIIELQNSLNPKEIKKDFDAQGGRIIGCNIENGATDIDYHTDRITVKFDKQMSSGVNGTSYGLKGKKSHPDFDHSKESFWTENEWTFFVILKPDTEYSIKFPAEHFMTYDGHPVLNTYDLVFRTKK